MGQDGSKLRKKNAHTQKRRDFKTDDLRDRANKNGSIRKAGLPQLLTISFQGLLDNNSGAMWNGVPLVLS